MHENKKALARLGTLGLGISPDPPDRQKKFAETYSLEFPLLSDPEKKTLEAYGVWGEKINFGRKYMGVIRSSFLIDEKGKIMESWYKVSPADTVPKALEVLNNFK